MLVLKRKVGEVIKIGNDIEVHVLDAEGDVIKLGFNAPKHISIFRSEVIEAISNENKDAINSVGQDAEAVLKQFGLRKNK